MLDEERIFAKLDELDGYLKELAEVKPTKYEEYAHSIEKKRSCERLLQIAIECVIDVCYLMVSGLRLGLPAEEADLFEKLKRKKIISRRVCEKLKRMKSFRNILVHRYGTVDDRLVFHVLEEDVNDFSLFREEVLRGLKIS